jgi:hypothetical protein
MPIPTQARTSALGGYVTGHGVELISESGVSDQAIERPGCRALGYGAARLQQNGHPVVPRDVLQHSRRQPLCNDLAKSALRVLVVLPRRMFAQGLSMASDVASQGGGAGPGRDRYRRAR